MAKKKKVTILPHVSYVCVGDNPPIRWDSLDIEKRREYSKKMMENVSEDMSRYYSSHPERLEELRCRQ